MCQAPSGAGPAVAVLALALIAWLLAHAQARELLQVGIAIAVGFVVMAASRGRSQAPA